MFKFKLPVNILRCRATKQFVVHTPALDLSTGAKTESQAIELFNEAVQLFLAELERMGTMNDVLTEFGWTKMRVSQRQFPWVPPELLHQKSVSVRLPATYHA